MREKLWEKALAKCKGGSVLMVWTARTSCGFDYRQHGTLKRRFVEFDGLPLVMRPKGDKDKDE